MWNSIQAHLICLATHAVCVRNLLQEMTERTIVISGFTRAAHGLMRSNISLSEFAWCSVSCLFTTLPNIQSLDSPAKFQYDTFAKQGLLLPQDAIAMKKINHLRMIHHNVQGLSSKYEEISEWLINSRNITSTILCCSEIWLTHSTCLPSVPGFDLFASPIHSRLNSNLPGSCNFVSTG